MDHKLFFFQKSSVMNSIKPICRADAMERAKQAMLADKKKLRQIKQNQH